MGGSELADWWDTQKRESEAILGDWVVENPEWWAIGAATAASTAMELGASFVDVLRLGSGFAQGTVRGGFQDVLRLLAIAGPLARGGATFARYAHTNSLRLAVTTADVTGPCTFTAVNNALSIVAGGGRNMFVTAREAARAMGLRLANVPRLPGGYDLAAWIDDLVPFLVRNGVRLRDLGRPQSLEDVIRAANTNDGVVIFAIEWTDLAGNVSRHSMIAVKTIRGVRFADYGGKFIADLGELAARGGDWLSTTGYQVSTLGSKGNLMLVPGMEWIGKLQRYARQVYQGGMLLVEGAHALQLHDGVDIGLAVEPVAAIEVGAHEPEVIKASFAAYKALRLQKPIDRLPSVTMRGRRNGAPPSHLLAGMQYRLNAAGCCAGRVDGKKGPRTEKATRLFQTTYKLGIDGIPGSKTQAKLVEVCGF